MLLRRVCLSQVCLDLYLMRQAAVSISAMPDVNTDWAALIDTWAVRFLHEMDYTREAANAQLFRYSRHTWACQHKLVAVGWAVGAARLCWQVDGVCFRAF
jgi:hypothetical protein